jgi:hypothetical protein
MIRQADKLLAIKEKENKMKNYNAKVKITWSDYGIEARSKKEAIKKIIALYKEQYNIDLEPSEIISLELETE